MPRHLRYIFAGVTLTALTVTGCATQSATNDWTASKNSTANVVSTNITGVKNTSVSNTIQPTNSAAPKGITTNTTSNVASMEIDAMPGAMLSTQWPLKGNEPY